jgi:glycosyltransferase involved in cell wall biosynthesis
MQAYCEDSDLAMTARAKGMRVVYEPRSELVHFEHGSYAEQGLADSSALQKHNTRLLLEKWKDIFETRHSPPVEWQVAASCAERSVPATAAERRRSGRLNILYFSPFPSHPASHGNRATIQSFARRFQDLGHAVHFVLLHGDGYAASDVADMRAAWETLDILENQNSLHMDPDGVPFDGWYGPGLGERIRVLCAKYDIDLVFCSYIFQSKLLDFVPNHMLKVIDTHDKMGDRYEMLRRNGQPLEFFSCTPEEEGAYLRRADIVVARRQEEARYFDSVSGRNTAIVIPHIEMPHFTTKQFTALSRVGVVASANRINLAILLEFLRSLDRQLAGSPCPFTVHIAGEVKDMVSTLSREDAAVFSAPWVRLRGFVPDIANFYGEMDAVVSPVTMGTGINVKTVQAMAYGMPLLTTAFGSKGIETTEPMHNFPNLDALAARLLQLSGTPGELVRLAEVSRERYQRFLDDSAEAIREMFRHPKLLPPASGD